LGPQISAQLRERFAERYDVLDAGPLAHEQAMQPVDVAVVLGFRSRYLGADVPNRFIADYVSRRPQQVVGFGGIDPTEPGALEAVGELPELGLAGVTISPAGQDFHPADTRAMRLYERCEQMRLPILLHQGTHYTRDSKMEYGRPYLFDEVARTFPKLVLIIAHCGHPWVDETLTLIGKHSHVFAELSNVVARPWQLYNVLQQAFQLGVMDRLLFGSDFPYMTPADAIQTIYSLNRFAHGTGLPAVPREQLRGIVERDVLGLLGLRRGQAAEPAETPRRNGGPRPTPTKVKEPQG
jgi:hypothetical protein